MNQKLWRGSEPLSSTLAAKELNMEIYKKIKK
jgi:hypothetical protein